ncbi:N-acyl-D-amino acid deacylase [Aliifodinibius salipaludis]|uniref:N-acyl-D-amino acid deacylase n=1 Tax=Fodinibius salipaludis TaxID=2032627 RepID=A0A2A2G7H8_9BACT|nr:amidohydrolase family protein [Aliifodinibius salipaludis]PAU92787.1 N-acyl-D-amino acid deacylase [Aliifodinibius salipaludis]
MILKKFVKLSVLLFAFGVLGIDSVCAQQQWDWHISGATIVDGTGEPSYKADILVRGDSIGYIGDVNADTIRAENMVDASGRIVTPGFIDPHAHGDPLETPEFHNFLAMGVTSIVLGQDGSSPDVGALNSWFAKVEGVNPAVNIALLSGHGSIRSKVNVGKQDPTQKELKRMQNLLQSDLDAGTFGMSTGLEYVPGMYAAENELEQLAKVVGDANGIIMSHMRSEDDSKIEASLNELAEQGEYASVHASHLKVVYGEGKGRAEEVLDHIDSFRDLGITMTADVYPYSASFTGIGIVFPDWAKTESEWQNALQERPEVLRQFLKNKVKQRNGPDAILFGSGKFAGLTLKEAADQESKSAIDLLMEMGPEAASAAHFVMDQGLQDWLMLGEGVMVSSDGSPTMRHPRGYGSFAKMIRYYVNEKELLSLEEAVYKMSGLPAKTLGLEERGLIQTGMKADLLIFNPQEIQDRATFENPHKLSEGFNWIMVNGTLVRKEGEFNKKRTGQILKGRDLSGE